MAKWNNIITLAGSSTTDTGSIILEGNSTVTGSLIVTGSSVVTGSLTVTQDITALGNLSASGDVIGSNLSGTNTGNVTLAGSYDYITLSGQTITRNQVDYNTDIANTPTIPTNNNQLTNGAGYTTNTGTVDTSGTPANDQLAIFTDSNTIEGNSSLTFDGYSLTVGKAGTSNNTTIFGKTGIVSASGAITGSDVYINDWGSVSASLASAGGGGAVATYTNGSNDRIITSTGTDGINGEANLTFDGSTLALNGNISSSGTSDNFFGGRIVLDNSKYIVGTETGGSTRNILSIDGSNITQVANGNLATNIKGTSISIDNALTLDAGDFTVTNGNVRLATNNTQITGKTTGGFERDIIGINASNVVVVGNSSTDEVELTGNTKVVGNLTLDDAVDTTLTVTGSIKFRIADATYTYQGELSPLAGSGLTTGEIVHYSGSGWVVADASDDTATKHLGVAVSATDVMIRGYIRNAAYVGLGTGNVLYLSTTAGDATITPPSTAGEYVRVLGYCVDGGSRIIYFNPSQDWIEL